MIRDDIIRMAREAGVLSGYESELFQRFAALVAAAEREACAKVCYEMFHRTGLWAALQLSDAIKARGQE